MPWVGATWLTSLLLPLAFLASCGGGDEDATVFDYGCGVDVPVDALVYFDRLGPEPDPGEQEACAQLEPIPYKDIDEEDVGCSIVDVDQEGGACNVTLKCEGEVFEGQYYDIDLIADFTELPVIGTAMLHVYEPDTGVECRSDYDVRIE